MIRPRVKVCCILSVEEAFIAINTGASALGLVSEMPSGPGVIDWDTISAIAERTPPGVATFLLTCSIDPGEIISQQRRAQVNTLQLCDELPAGSHRRLREELPGVGIVQVIHVTGEASIEEAVSVSPYVHALLLDSGNPALAVKELGGTGRVHDWALSRQIVERVAPTPVFLAGGLRPDNVGEAVEQVRPYGLDLCSGVRSNGKLDAEKLEAFFRAF